MKNIFLKTYLVLLMAAAMSVSCNDWLDVEPSDQIGDKALFKSALGFRNLLNGIYSQMGSSDLYGRNLTWGLASFMGQDYVTGAGRPEDKAAQIFEYENADLKKVTSAVWVTAYNTIANCNKLIFEIEKKEDDFFPQGRSERNLILGEAMAIRALLHFEMIRLFAPAPVTGDNGRYIPYYHNYTVNFESPLQTGEALGYVIADLLAAKDLVAENDTITNKGYLFPGDYDVRTNKPGAGEDMFFTGRGLRLNYVAINGLLARVYLYAGQTAKAREYAQYVYSNFSPDAEDENATLGKWSFTRVVGTEAHAKLKDDILFSLADSYLVKKYQDYRTGHFPTPLYLRYIMAGLMTLDDTDFRFKLIEIQGASNERSRKWEPTGVTGENPDRRDYSLIPVIRMSEIYYILSETLLDTDLTVAETIYQAMRKHRGQSRVVTGRQGILEDLPWEYRKEFMTEGQTFFFFKRLNRPIETTIGNITPPSFVLPKPDSENLI